MLSMNTFQKMIFLSKKLLEIDPVPEFKDNYHVRAYWEKNKRRIRAFFAVAIIAFNLFGVELSTPHYSLTTEIAKILIDNDSMILRFRSFDRYFINVANKDGLPVQSRVAKDDAQLKDVNNIEFGNNIKLGAYLLFIFVGVFIFIFINLDPFSKKHLIRGLVDNKRYRRRKKLPNFKDMEAYAVIAPSNQLFFRCKECRHLEYCENNLLVNEHKRNEIWTKIFVDLDADVVNDNLRLLNQCRKWHFVKYSLLFSSLFLVFVYLAVRASEYLIGCLSPSLNWELLLLVFVSLVAFVVLHRIDPSLNDLKDNLNIFYLSDQFRRQFKEKTCQREDAKEVYDPVGHKQSGKNTTRIMCDREIQTLKMTIEYFTLIHRNGIDKLVENYSCKIRRKLEIENVLSYIVHMFERIYSGGGPFAASLLVPENEELKTWITKSTNGGSSCNFERLREVNRKNVFGLNGSSVAAKCWRHNRALSSNTGVVFVYENQQDRLKSLIAMPIECSKPLYMKMNKDKYRLDKIIGILCVTSSDGAIFTRKRCRMNTLILNPFVSMIYYQYSLRLFETVSKSSTGSKVKAEPGFEPQEYIERFEDSTPGANTEVGPEGRF